MLFERAVQALCDVGVDFVIVGGVAASLDLPALLRSKRAAGRVKDLLLLPELESLVEAREPEPPK